MAFSTIWISIGIISLLDWWLLFRATLKQDQQAKLANQPSLGMSTYYMLLAYLITIIVVGIIGFLASPDMAVSSLHTWTLIAYTVLIWCIYKLSQALVGTIVRFIIIRHTSKRYLEEAKKEKRDEQ